MQTVLKMQGPDGLLYIPIKGRPWALPDEANPWAMNPLPTGDHWCSIVMNGRWLGGFCTYALRDPAGPWVDAARRIKSIVPGSRRHRRCGNVSAGISTISYKRIQGSTKRNTAF